MTIALFIITASLGGLLIYARLGIDKLQDKLDFANDARKTLSDRLLEAQRKIESIERPNTFVIATSRRAAYAALERLDLNPRDKSIMIATSPRTLEGLRINAGDRIIWAGWDWDFSEVDDMVLDYRQYAEMVERNMAISATGGHDTVWQIHA